MQSERLIKFTDAKKGLFPSSLLPAEQSLLSHMLHHSPDQRPETRHILHSRQYSWIREERDEAAVNLGLPVTIRDIIQEEELDN